MNLWLAFAAVWSVWMSLSLGTLQPATRPADRPPTPYRLLVISIDGARPDLLLRADMPNLRKVLKAGSYSMWAKTTAQAITMPSHISMLTGVSPNVHQIFWNSDLPLKEPVYPKSATLFEVAKSAGYTTAMVAGKDKFSFLNKPGTLDHVWITTEGATTNENVIREALRVLRDHRPEVMFVHFPETDNVGHGKGWGTDEQMAVFDQTDRQLGQLLGALDELGVSDSTYVIISADHGGQGRVHGPDDIRSRTIPWIVRGPGIRANFDLGRVTTLEIRTEDTFATGCELLKIPLPKPVEGKPVLAALKDVELMR